MARQPQRGDDKGRSDRISRLKDRAASAANGPMWAWEADDLPDEVAERFWQHVVDFETGDAPTYIEQLTALGVTLPEPETMNDQQLHAKLWEVIRGLAKSQVFLDFTDHLSDRALYTLLVREVLHDGPMPGPRLGPTIIDLGDSGEDVDDGMTYMKYYADDKFRQDWLADNPDAPPPEHVEPPYDRDQHMPVPDDMPPRK